MSEKRWTLQYVNDHPGLLSPNSPFVIPAGYANVWYTGKIFKTVEGYFIKVIDYVDKYHVTIEFTERPGEYYNVSLNSLRTGSIKNPYKPNRFGGVFGNGPYTKNSHTKLYYAWMNMLARLSEEFQQNSRNRAYKSVSICPEWMNYQNFAFWYDNYLKILNPAYYDKYQIDKDILQWGQPGRIYSPVTCCVVPEDVNLLLSNLNRTKEVESDLPLAVHRDGTRYQVNISGHSITKTFATPEEAFAAYKVEKTNLIRNMADRYYNEGAITKDVHDKLYSIDIKPFNNY